MIAEWGEDLGASHSAGTVAQYLHVARAQWLTRWERLGEITTLAIGDYQRDRLREVTRETTRKHIVALRTFLAWCVERGALEQVPAIPRLAERATGVRARKAIKREPLTAQQIAKLISKLPVLSSAERRSDEQRYRVRDWAIIAWETALRPTTIAQLRLGAHWALGRREITIADEADKIRFGRAIPITARAREALTRCARGKEVDELLLGPHDYDPYLVEAGLKALGRAVHEYDMRHSRLTALVRSGRDLLGVQYLAGHRSLATTARYAHPSAEAAKRALRAAKG